MRFSRIFTAIGDDGG